MFLFTILLNERVITTTPFSSNELLHVEMDGEGFYAKSFTIKIIPGGVKVFAPEGLDFTDNSHKAYTNVSNTK